MLLRTVKNKLVNCVPQESTFVIVPQGLRVAGLLKDDSIVKGQFYVIKFV